MFLLYNFFKLILPGLLCTVVWTIWILLILVKGLVPNIHELDMRGYAHQTYLAQTAQFGLCTTWKQSDTVKSYIVTV